MEVADGLHVYGRRERRAWALSVRVDGERVRARIPAGTRVRYTPGLPVSWWLQGTQTVEVRSDTAHGTLHYQAYAGSICGPPSQVAWSTD